MGEAYALGYTGLAAIYRLRFIAHHCPMLEVEALKLAISHVMNTHNAALYSELHKKLVKAMKDEQSSSGGASANLPDVAVAASASGGGGSNPSNNDAMKEASPVGNAASVREWIEVRNKKAALKLEKLDTDLKNYKSNSIKESIRRGHDDLGDHFLDGGDLANALKCYSRARDYCTSGRHVMSMCINVIKVSVYLQNWSHVISYVNKALATPELSEESKVKNNEVLIVMTRLKCAGGLADLMTRKYSSAAKQFLAASLDHCDCPDLISPNNVAIYGGLTALATFDRAELLKQVISSTQFKLFLELEPQLREVLQCFYDSRYGHCLKLLEDMKDNLLLDLYLAPHIQTLFSMIRNRGLVQYFSPYISADLAKMAVSFNTTIPNLENELMKLILDGSIQARIDSHNRVLLAQDVDQRSQTFARAVEMSRLYSRRARTLVLRSAIMKANINVKCVTG